MIEFLVNYSWIVWLALVLIFIIVETLTLDLIFLMLAIGSLAGVVSDRLAAPWWLQIILAAAVSLLLIVILRPPLLSKLKKSSGSTKSNVEALIGLHGQVLTAVSPTEGQVKLSNGEIWSARLGEEQGVFSGSIAPGKEIRVTAIQGATALVKHEEKG